MQHRLDRFELNRRHQNLDIRHGFEERSCRLAGQPVGDDLRLGFEASHLDFDAGGFLDGFDPALCHQAQLLAPFLYGVFTAAAPAPRDTRCEPGRNTKLGAASGDYLLRCPLFAQKNGTGRAGSSVES